MALAQHKAAVRSSERSSRGIRRLFARMGTASNPRGGILRAYRTARRSLQGRLDSPADLPFTRDVLEQLRADVMNTSREIIESAAALGFQEAQTLAEIYGLTGFAVRDATVSSAALGSLQTTIDGQIELVAALLLSGAGEGEILGSGVSRLGLLAPGVFSRQLGRWITTTAEQTKSTTIGRSIERSEDAIEFVKQAIAGLDERTTDCCLRAHAQIVKMDQPFRLVGTPRYADFIQWPPFHWYCRTSGATILKEDREDVLTEEMALAARAEIDARETTGERVEIHPASALSRR